MSGARDLRTRKMEELRQKRKNNLESRAQLPTVHPLPILAKKGGNHSNNMKYLALLAIVAGSLVLGACAHHEASTSTTTTSSTGYKK